MPVALKKVIATLGPLDIHYPIVLTEFRPPESFGGKYPPGTGRPVPVALRISSALEVSLADAAKLGEALLSWVNTTAREGGLCRQCFKDDGGHLVCGECMEKARGRS